MWWLGLPSVQEAVRGINKEERFKKRAFQTKLIGFAAAIIGAIFIIKSFF